MKKSELKRIIREEIKRLDEADSKEYKLVNLKKAETSDPFRALNLIVSRFKFDSKELIRYLRGIDSLLKSGKIKTEEELEEFLSSNKKKLLKLYNDKSVKETYFQKIFKRYVGENNINDREIPGPVKSWIYSIVRKDGDLDDLIRLDGYKLYQDVEIEYKKERSIHPKMGAVYTHTYADVEFEYAGKTYKETINVGSEGFRVGT